MNKPLSEMSWPEMTPEERRRWSLEWVRKARESAERRAGIEDQHDGDPPDPPCLPGWAEELIETGGTVTKREFELAALRYARGGRKRRQEE
jgi:hypothetical protein